MHIVIMGCGRVGAGLALTLEEEGHSVSIIDQEREAFRRLGPNFKGKTVTGVGFDRDILVEAGIEKCDAFAAVSNGDNSNILAARVARETYNIKNVVARIYDPARAEIYQRLGIPTVATVSWTEDQIHRRLIPAGARSEWRDQSGKISLCEVFPHEGWIGKPISLIDELTAGRVGLITRLGEATLPHESTVLQEGDILHILIAEKDINQVVAQLAKAPE